MGIPNQYILKERLNVIDREFKKEYGLSIQFVEYEPEKEKASVLFEYFVLYNTVLAYKPDKIIEINLKQRSGPTYLPLPGIKYWKTVSKIGEAFKPSITIKKNKTIINFWFDKPLVYFKRLTSIRPDIVVRVGNFRVQDNISYDKFKLFREEELIIECSVSPLRPEEGYQILESLEFKGKKVYLKFREKFIHPKLIIECKSFGAVLGNIEKYASYAKQVIIVSPEKLYQPKGDNIHLIKLGKNLESSEFRKKLIPFLTNS